MRTWYTMDPAARLLLGVWCTSWLLAVAVVFWFTG